MKGQQNIQFLQIPTLRELTDLFPKVTTYLWDMDGTLFNTEKIHLEATKALILKGMNWRGDSYYQGFSDNQLFSSFGKDNLIAKKIKLAKFIRKKDRVFYRMIKKSHRDDLLAPQIIALLEEARASGIQMALVTSSEKKLTKFLLKKFHILRHFSLIITSEDVLRTKPSGIPYLKAMKQLGKEPDECLIFEDSQTGLLAAQRSRANFCEAKWYNA